MASLSYFKSDDKLNEKYDYQAWKMSLDLTLEEHDAMDYVQGKITKPPSNASAATKTKCKTTNILQLIHSYLSSVACHILGRIFVLCYFCGRLLS